MRSLPIDVPAGPRAEILRCVHEEPGIHLRRIERETKLALGQVLYHLDRLERMGLLVSSRDAGFRRYFAAHEVARGDKPFVGALRPRIPRAVQLALLEHGPQTHKALQQRLGLAPSTLSFHLQRLVAANVLVRERAGTANIYALADAEATQRALVSYRSSFRDPEVDRYVEETDPFARRTTPLSM
ncbi:MAG TPA: crosslink repair DNA glycosylase YcaQ family protein [Candidatus Thermoplasmatota archaeon]|nr:crosslink repair DNA glycosylase YcaQ family protein [Candidatus Thermoplasmatota archaeon]